MSQEFYSAVVDEGWRYATERHPLPTDRFWENVSFSVLMTTLQAVPLKGIDNVELRKKLYGLLFKEVSNVQNAVDLYDASCGETELRRLLMDRIIKEANSFEDWLLIYFRAEPGSKIETTSLYWLNRLPVSRGRLLELLAEFTYEIRPSTLASLRGDESGDTDDPEKEKDGEFLTDKMQTPLYPLLRRRLTSSI